MSRQEYEDLLALRQKILQRAAMHENNGRRVLAALERNKASGVAAALALLKSRVGETRRKYNENRRAAYMRSELQGLQKVAVPQ